jgi:hypothetical protein
MTTWLVNGEKCFWVWLNVKSGGEKSFTDHVGNERR